MTDLFSSFEYKGLKLPNRIVMPPMCQYSVEKEDGIPSEWHDVHYISRAVGGTGFIIAEMSGIHPDGRITNRDTGIWSDEMIPAWRKIVDGIHRYGAKAAIQLGHAGRKAEDAQPPVAPSAIAFDDTYRTPRALTTEEVRETVRLYADAARRAIEAGFDTVEIHGAHGYLIHQFHSPLTNKRDDEYGRDLALFGEEVTRAVRAEVPADMPVLMRVSAAEYVDGGYGVDEIIETCRRYRDAGAEIFHISSGGEGPIGAGGAPGAGPGYQVVLAEKVREALGVPVIAVGMLDEFVDAQRVVTEGRAELVAIGRGMLRDPYWAVHASRALSGVLEVPEPYRRGYRASK
ncbi:NADPH dehydrogenase [Saccharibacillus sp. CPCC 101409]|uniref:oxidoreductase n=1 Tax=Saccharibacillus sp. CPCC 101409 TaxID=3058041 RepID=UPI002673B25D|nr:NADPH dehydrogenase [Saccharibacillus sp. CPCC 101409]MDO3412159.1 NADPH dehydrogenase [Saccharibacillus sp. CPCC 101409]